MDRPSGFATTYDPVRDGTVMLDQGNQVVRIFRDDWELLAVDYPQNFTPFTSEYDYAARGIVAVAQNNTYMLPSTSTTWMQVAPGLMGASSSAYDVNQSRVVVQASAPDVVLLDLVGGQWEQSLSAGASYTLASALHSGSVLLVPFMAGPQLNRQVWERRDGVFATTGAFPLDGVEGNHFAELPRGRHLFMTRDVTMMLMVERQLTSTLPDESCAAGEDIDGDGLAGCDDADCWWTCWRACPIATSCP
jgi:hypothetical protein